MKKEIDQEFEWDRKRIVIGAFFIIVALVFAFEVKGMFLDKNKSVLGETNVSKPEEIEKPNIKPPSVNLQSEFTSKVNEIKKNINSLDASEIASSSPQIQKVLQDIQGIKDLPANQAKDACLKICSGI